MILIRVFGRDNFSFFDLQFSDKRSLLLADCISESNFRFKMDFGVFLSLTLLACVGVEANCVEHSILESKSGF